MQTFRAIEVFGGIIESLQESRSVFIKLGQAYDKKVVKDLLVTLSRGKMNKREEILLIKLKIYFAIVGLSRALGRPPTISEITEVTGLNYFKVRRFVEGKEGEEFRQLLKIKGTSFTDFRFRKEGMGKDVIFHRKPVGRSVKDWTGGSSKLYVSTRLHPIEILNEVNFLPGEKDMLMGYLSESYFADLVRETILEMLQLIERARDFYELLVYNQEVREAIYQFCKPIGESILQIADKKRRRKQECIPYEVRFFYSFEWLLSPPQEIFEGVQKFFSEDLAKAKDSLKEIPNDLFVNALSKKSWIKEVEEEACIEVMGEPTLCCSVCRCETLIDMSQEEFKCGICGSIWKIG